MGGTFSCMCTLEEKGNCLSLLKLSHANLMANRTTWAKLCMGEEERKVETVGKTKERRERREGNTLSLSIKHIPQTHTRIYSPKCSDQSSRHKLARVIKPVAHQSQQNGCHSYRRNNTLSEWVMSYMLGWVTIATQLSWQLATCYTYHTNAKGTIAGEWYSSIDGHTIVTKSCASSL